MLSLPVAGQFGIAGERAGDPEQFNAETLLVMFQRRLCNGEFGNPASDHDRHVGDLRDVAGEIDEIGLARLGRCFRSRIFLRIALHGRAFIAAAGKLHEIQPMAVQPFNHLLRIVRAEPAALEICRIQLQPDPEGQFHARSHGLYNPHQETGAVFQAAAPFIVALVGQRGQELTDQITMRAVDLHTIKTGFLCRFGGVGKPVDDRFDFCCLQPPHRREQG